VKVTEIEQLPAGGVSTAEHALVTANDPASPPTETPLIVAFAVPPLDTVSTRTSLVEFSVSAPNATLVAETVTDAAPPLPVPLNAIVVVPTLCTMARLALFAPLLDGVNVTLIVQLAPAANVAGATGQAFDVAPDTANCPACAPLTVVLVIVSAAPPLLVSVSVRAALLAPTP
jgi:hypothetical protein